MSYQDQRPVQPRYEMMKAALGELKPKSVLDFGCAEGGFGRKIMATYGSFLVEVDREPMVKGLVGDVYLQKEFSIVELEMMAECERFDLILALNIVHHFKEWERAVDAFLQMGQAIIIETPGLEDRGSCNFDLCHELLFYLESLGPTTLGYTQSHVTPGVKRPMFLFKKPFTPITIPYVQPPPFCSCHIEKIGDMMSKKGETRQWIEGLNLWTYLKLGGEWPTKGRILKWLGSLTMTSAHGDVRPWNFLICSDGLRLIDGGDEKATFDDREGLEITRRFIEGKGGL